MRGTAGGTDGFGDMPGQDSLYKMDVDFADAILGAEREITLPTGKRLRVKIPAGVDAGSKLRFAGFGSAGIGKGPPGDAYVELNIRPSPIFKREGRDLEVELPISFSEAILGGEVRAPTIDGSVMLKVPAGVSSGARLRVAGKGVQSGDKRGDQYVVLKIMVPSSVDADLKQALESWTKREKFDPRSDWIGAKGGKV
jgi:DnaJ-class molecular chaperone